MKWLLDWWRRRQRSIDCQFLWPSCVAQAGSLELAKMAFMVHAFSDSAWVCHYGEGLWPKIDTFTAAKATP